MTRCLYVFPGQGSQYPGMGSDLCQQFDTAARVYERASEVLGYDAQRLSFTDPDQQLNLTRYTQPALLTHHYACLSVYRELSGSNSLPFAAAGHSLGEYSALVAAGAMSFEQALALVQVRGELMGAHGEGEMLATQLDLATAQPLADKHYCGIGALNLPRQTVVGGSAADLDALAAEIEAAFPRSRSVRLKTEGAFHTYFMVEAARRFRPVLAEAEIQPPQTRVLSNYTGGYHDDEPASIRSRLFFQLFHPVNWITCLQTALDDEVDTFLEFGGGIGGGDTPAEKRPNLESVIKRAARSAGHETRYLAAINVASIREAVAAGK